MARRRSETAFDPPRIDRLEPDRGRPGTVITLSGEFGERRPPSAILFKHPGFAGPTVVREGIRSWSPTRIRAVVPGFPSGATGGPVDVSVRNTEGIGKPRKFVLLEQTTPTLTALAPGDVNEGAEMRIAGRGFGHAPAGPGRGPARTGRSRVTFSAPGSLGTADATIVTWTATEIRARAPAASNLGGGGPKQVVVETPWGKTNALELFLGELPSIASITPHPAAPDTLVTIAGSGFRVRDEGSVILKYVHEDIDTDQTTPINVPMEVLGWTATEIRAVVPGLPALQVSGLKKLCVQTPRGESKRDFRVTERASITSWTRVEPHARTDDLQLGLELGLQARLEDALWLLGRQWQLGELRGEDAGSAARAEATGEIATIGRWRPGPTGPASAVPAAADALPLEVLAEREPVFGKRGDASWDGRLAVEAGLQFLRHLAVRVRVQERADAYRREYVREYPLIPTDEERNSADPESARFLAVSAGRVPDGARLYVELGDALPPDRGGSGKLPARPEIAADDRTAVLTAVSDWYRWCETFISQPTPGTTTWDSERMEHTLAISAETGTEEVVLSASEYASGRLDWFSFDRDPTTSLRSAPSSTEGTPQSFTRTLIPTAVAYPGMPALRWWEMEDASVDFGAVDAGPADLLRMLLIEFVTIYGNDWLLIPVGDVPVGSLVEITSLRVTDVFGRETQISAFAGSEARGHDWSMYQLSRPDERDERDLLFLPPTVVGSLEAPALEEVLLLRDEMANLGWAVERVVAGRTGRPLRCFEADQAQRGREQSERTQLGAEPSADSPALHYRLSTSVPDYWIPLVPFKRDSSHRLVRGAIRRLKPDGTVEDVRPQGVLLEPERPLELYEEEVPLEGARITRGWQLARAPDGSTHLWIGRRKETGVGEASSGLRFDIVQGSEG